MPTEALIAIGGVVATAILGAFAAWIRWSIRTAVGATITGAVRPLGEGVQRLESWTKAHDRRHSYEQRQLIAALSRQGIVPPDGWDLPETTQVVRGREAS